MKQGFKFLHEHRYWVLLWLIVVVAGLTTIALPASWFSQRLEKDAFHDAANRSELFARAYAEHAHSIASTVDFAAQQLADDWTPDWRNFNESSRRIIERMGNVSVQIGATDASGMLVVSNLKMQTEKVDLTDRAHIKVHLTGQDTGLYISEPVKGRVSNKWSIQFSRAIKQGKDIKGVVVISLDPFYFTKFYDGLQLEQNDVITMLKKDGSLLAMGPLTESAFGKIGRAHV